MNALKKFIRDKLLADPVAANVAMSIGVPGGFAVERVFEDGFSTRLEIHAYGGVTVLDLVKSGASTDWKVDVRSSSSYPDVAPNLDVFPVCFKNHVDAKRTYDEIKKSLISTQKLSTKIFRGIVLALAIGLLAIVLMPVPATGVAQATLPSQPAVSPTPVVNESVPEEARLTQEERVKVSSAKGAVQYPGQGAPYYVFSDPNCPFCKKQEAELSGVDPSFKPVVLPLGYKTGSRDMASSIMCSADPVKAWKSWMVDGVKPTAPACEKGYEAVDSNMRLFESLRLNGTPSMITPHGWILSGFASAQDLSVILGKQ